MTGVTIQALMDYLQIEHQQRMLIEGAGLFWILAELLILYAVLVGRRCIETRPLPGVLALTSRERHRAMVWALIFVGAASALFVRHFVGVPIHASIEAVAQGTLPLNMLGRTYTARTHTHMTLWAVFVALWVALECVIVYHGWRAYRALREVLRG
jgi:hypothetical protein